MPIYEYRCDSCDYELEALQKLSDKPLSSCPSCEATALRRLVSAPSFRLKGDGWYETDFKSDKEKKRNLVDNSGTTETKDDKKSKSTDSDKDSKKSGNKSKDTKSSDSSAKKDSSAETK